MEFFPQPNATPPKEQHHWKADLIPIPNVPGKPPLNLSVIFSGSEFCKSSESLSLPPEIYPPKWDERKKVEDIIMESALKNGGINLVRGQTKCIKGKNVRHTYLVCNHGICYRAPKKGDSVEKENKENYTKAGVKLSRIVNKGASSRGPQAIYEAKRAQSVKPMEKSEKCNFQFRLTLHDGDHWSISHRPKCDAWHNHPKINVEEDRGSVNHMSPDQQEFAQDT